MDKLISDQFYKSALNALVEQIAIIDSDGRIVFVNDSWKRFSDQNDGCGDVDWHQSNYIHCCESAASNGDTDAIAVLDGLKKVISQSIKDFVHEYPCHCPEAKRWFLMRVSSFSVGGEQGFIVTHSDITQRKLAEEEIFKLAYRDELTQIANRRHYDLKVEQQWKIAVEESKPLGMLLIDIDDFKQINDKYGHQVGDEVLRVLARELKALVKRDSDVCARIGGDEFVVIIDGASMDIAISMGKSLLEKIQSLNTVAMSPSNVCNFTVSIGVNSVLPTEGNSFSKFMNRTDRVLYAAKESGKNTMVVNSMYP